MTDPTPIPAQAEALRPFPTIFTEVYIARKIPGDWIPEMDSWVGTTGVIRAIENGRIKVCHVVDGDYSDYFWFPAAALSLADAQAPGGEGT